MCESAFGSNSVCCDKAKVVDKVGLKPPNPNDWCWIDGRATPYEDRPVQEGADLVCYDADLAEIACPEEPAEY